MLSTLLFSKKTTGHIKWKPIEPRRTNSFPFHLFYSARLAFGHRGCVRELYVLEATKGWSSMDLWIVISSSLTFLMVIGVIGNVWAK
jgi:hypothetical protein